MYVHAVFQIIWNNIIKYTCRPIWIHVLLIFFHCMSSCKLISDIILHYNDHVVYFSVKIMQYIHVYIQLSIARTYRGKAERISGLPCIINCLFVIITKVIRIITSNIAFMMSLSCVWFCKLATVVLRCNRKVDGQVRIKFTFFVVWLKLLSSALIPL